MARSRKSKDTSASDTAPKDASESEAIEDAVVLDETAAGAPGDQPEAEAVEAGDAESGPAAEDASDDSASEASDEAAAESGADECREVAEPETVDDSGAAQDSAPVELATAPAPTAPTPVEVQRVGFFPVLFGGVIAAALGAGALYYASERGWAGLGGGDTEALVAEIAGLKTEIGTLQDEISTLRDGLPDIAPVNDAVAALQGGQGELTTSTAALSEAVDGLTTRIDTTDARVAEVETQPIPMAQLPEEIRNAYDRQVAAMEAQVDERFASVQATLDAKLAEIEAAQAAAAEQEQQAMDAVRAAEARAALAEIEVALDTGSGYGEALAALNDSADVSADAALTGHAEDGVPSLPALQASFPDAARAALNASTRAAADSGDVNPVTAFLRTQLGARSLEPREGDDPDAVLSRAEAALAGGDLDATLSEIAALPEAGQAALAAWVGDAETRRAALTALADLSAQLTPN